MSESRELGDRRRESPPIAHGDLIREGAERFLFRIS